MSDDHVLDAVVDRLQDAKNDNEKLASLLLLTKLPPVTDPTIIERICNATGHAFIGR